ncbi:MAG: glutamate mutase L [Sulfurospirillum sp.]|nr:glutamate mutase L [Sulfurospirillum sp.]
MSKLLIDVGSTYFKTSSSEGVAQAFRDFSMTIFDDLSHKFANKIAAYKKEDIYICSSANGGLSTLIIGLTNSFSLKYAKNIAFNSGINIIDTVLVHELQTSVAPTQLLDVVIVVGGIDSVGGIYDTKLISYLAKLRYSNIVYVGNTQDVPFLRSHVEALVVLENIIDNKLKVREEALKEYLTNLYQQDIVGKEDIKQLYAITANQIFSTPYIVNRSLPFIGTKFAVVDPFIVVDIGGATTDIHYSRDLVRDNIVSENGFDRLVFKKLGVYKSRESLVFAAKSNEFVYEMLNYLNVTENILEEQSEKATKILMLLSIFLVLYKVSSYKPAYVTLNLERLNALVFTGGITKVLSQDEVLSIVHFFYKKVLNTNTIPTIVLDHNYDIWTLGMHQ